MDPETYSALDETCRDCRNTSKGSVAADFILWGKYFDQAAFGPKCAEHARKWFDLSRVDQYAVFDLRRARTERDDLRQDRAHAVNQMVEARQTLQQLGDRVDEFVFQELASALDDLPSPQE